MKIKNPNIETIALMIVILSEKFRSQMMALLIKNGVVVNNDASSKKIALLISNLLKVSKSFSEELTLFVSNRSVATVIADEISKHEQFSNASGSGYLNIASTGIPSSIGYQSQYGLNFSTKPAELDEEDEEDTKPSFWSTENITGLFGKGVDLFSKYTTNKTDADIARAQAQRAKYEAGYGGKGDVKNEIKEDDDDGGDTGMSAVTIVVISLVGVALIGTIAYFIVKSKK